MKTSIAIAALLIVTGCQAPTGAEISAASTASPATAASPEEAPATPSTPTIDYSPRAPENYPSAITTCASEARQLCTISQYRAAYAVGGLEYVIGQPGNYWMPTTTISAQNKNLFQATADGINYMLQDTTLNRPFYCCNP